MKARKLSRLESQSSSAALNRPATPFRAPRQCSLGRSFLREPIAFSAQGRSHPHEVPPFWRIMVSKTGAVISSTRVQCSPTGSRSGSSDRARMHRLRRKTECGFTLARFSMLWATSGRKEPGKWSACAAAPGDECSRNEISCKTRGFALFASVRPRKSRLHRAGFQASTNVSSCGSCGDR